MSALPEIAQAAAPIVLAAAVLVLARFLWMLVRIVDRESTNGGSGSTKDLLVEIRDDTRAQRDALETHHEWAKGDAEAQHSFRGEVRAALQRDEN